MSIQYDNVWRLTLRTPQSLKESELRDLVLAEKEGIPGAPYELMRVLEPPLMVDGSVTSMLPMQFHILGTLMRENTIFKSGVPKGADTQTTAYFSIGPRPGAPARIEWEAQVRMLEEAVREAGGSNRQVKLRSLVTRERAAHERKIRVADMERRTAEQGPGYSLRTINGDLITVPNEAALPFGQPVRVVFKVNCTELPDMGNGLFALGRVQYIAYV